MMSLPGNGPFDFLNKLDMKSSDTSNERAAPRGSPFGNTGSAPANLRATPTAPTGENVSTLAETAESSSRSDTVFGDAPSTTSSSCLGGDRPGNGSG